MRLGIDFDNTIVCYDTLFHRVALERGCIPPSLPANKSEVRNHLRLKGQEHVWTELQGVVYGGRMAEARPYPEALHFFAACRRAGIPVFIISHKTRRPFLGESHDLHQAALEWLKSQGFFDPHPIGLPPERVFFELTKQEKLARIIACDCTHFIDDLPEFLAEPSFPANVVRWLFDPNDLYAEETRFDRFRGWADAIIRLGLSQASHGSRSAALRAGDRSLQPVLVPGRRPAPRSKGHPRETRNVEPSHEPRIRRFLADCGIPDVFSIEALPGGANNRVLRINAAGRAYVLKQYFLQSTDDPRDRFRTERAFYRWAWEQGIRRTPQPLGWEEAERLGLFEFVTGRKLQSSEVDEGGVDQALAFVSELNAARHEPAASTLPEASEACFSVAEHLDRVGRRVERLADIHPRSEVDRDALEFVRRELSPSWRATRDTVTGSSSADTGTVLSPSQRCLSPSDFGFHNALLATDGRLRFFDFEYAGWDDPAKLICDFFCQPQVAVPIGHWNRVVGSLQRALGWPDALADRASLLLPAYRIKWCCILLNEFLRGGRERRDFALGGVGEMERKQTQLAKARAVLVAPRLGYP